jgi:uncharacterized protein YndB with AHSA1/START domain
MRSVRCNIEIAASPDKIIGAFTVAEKLKGWWGVERSLIELKPGGIYTLAWGISESGISYISTGVIRQYEPAGFLHIGDYMYLNPGRPFMGPLELMIEASPAANGSLLKLEQGPYPEGFGEHWDWYYEVVKEAWPKVLQTLKQFLENEI